LGPISAPIVNRYPAIVHGVQLGQQLLALLRLA
jgi:hypothetical protein